MKSKNLPATQGMLQLVRTELKADIRGLRSEMKAGFSSMDAKFAGVDSRFSDLDAKFAGIDSRFSDLDAKFAGIDSRFSGLDVKFASIDSRFSSMDSKLENIAAEVARLGLLVEEQNANNRIVLEGLSALWQRQDQFEGRLVDEVQTQVTVALARAKG